MDARTINEHLQNLFEEGELSIPRQPSGEFRTVRREGQRHVAGLIEHYNLAAILAVGYGARSPRGAQSRRWAAERLSEYLVRGFTMDDELLERIHDIRASETRMYLRVRETPLIRRPGGGPGAPCRRSPGEAGGLERLSPPPYCRVGTERSSEAQP